MSYVITGSATSSGAPLYRTGTSWSVEFADATVLDGDARELALSRAREEESTVCDPYAIAVAVDEDGTARPTSLRERIRADGPTFELP